MFRQVPPDCAVLSDEYARYIRHGSSDRTLIRPTFPVAKPVF